MIRKKHFRKMHILRKSLIFMLLVSLLFSSVYAVTSTDSSSGSAAASSKLNDAIVVSEDTSKRGEFEKHYLLSDGSFVAVSYPEAIHYLSEDGTWEEVDNRLSLDRATSHIVNGNGNFSVSFADRPSGNSMVALLHNGRAFIWGLTAAKSESGELAQLNTFSTDEANIVSDDVASLLPARSDDLSTASASAIGKKASDADAFASDKLSGKLGYAELFKAAPELSVEYSVFQNKIEEDIFIHSPTDLRTFSMNIQADGLIARLNDDGSVDFLDEKGDMQYRIGIPYMVDASNEVLNDIQVTVDQSGKNCTVTYTPDEAWLTSEDRVYPILLDPSVTTKEYNSNIVDTYVYEGNTANHSAEQYLYYGVKSGKIYRTYIKINNLPHIDASMPVLGATMQLNFVSGTTSGKTAQVYKASGSWNAETITYANQPAIDSYNRLDSCLYHSSAAYMTFDLSTDVTTLYDEFLAANNDGYVVKYEDESNTNPDYNMFHSTEYTKASKRPVVTITYGYALPSSLTDGGEYSFQNCGSFSYMTVHNGTDANDVNVYLQSVSDVSNLGTRHKFKLECVPSTGGYYLRSMSSSGGKNRVLDIYKINGYVSNGSNVQIYAPNDSLAQHWFIIGTGFTTFKIVPRTDMSLALTAYPGGDGSSSGKTTTSAGNIFVSTYDDTNDYQQWMIYDANGNMMSGSYQNIQNDTYYLNNSYYGKYLHKLNAASVDAKAGTISSLGNTIRWKITHIGNNQYTIQSSDDLTKYLYSGSSTSVSLTTTSNITSNYLWSIRSASSGGIRVQNVATQAYLQQTGPSTISVASSLSSQGLPDTCSVWRLAGIDYMNGRELLSGFSIDEISLTKSVTKTPTINKVPSNALWADSNDFTYSLSNPTGYTGSVTINGNNITGSTYGVAQIKATHKVTGKTTSFDVDIEYDINGLDSGATYYIKNVSSDTYLSVDGLSDINNASVGVSNYSGAANQVWRINLRGNSEYQFYPSNITTSKALTISNGSLKIFTDSCSSQQRFVLIRQESLLYNKSGQYYIMYDGKYLSTSMDGKSIELTTVPNTNYGCSLWCFEEVSKGEIALFNFSEFTIKITQSKLSETVDNLGYSISYHLDATKVTGLEKLKSASIWLHTGHGASAQVNFYNSNIYYYDVDALEQNELSNLRCFITLGCSSGLTDEYGNNIIDSIYSKGAQFALGFTHTQYTGVAETWLVRFLDYSNQGNTIKDSIQYADKVANLPFFGTGMKYYMGDDLQRLSR